MSKPSWWKDKYYAYGHHRLSKDESERCGHPGARPGIVCQKILKDGKCRYHDPSS